MFQLFTNMAATFELGLSNRAPAQCVCDSIVWENLIHSGHVVTQLKSSCWSGGCFSKWSVKGSDLSTEAYGTARNSTTDIKKQMGETIETGISSLLIASEMQTQALAFNKRQSIV